jgi:MurNAc alpha-1-phosphate uridylyltransferase
MKAMIFAAGRGERMRPLTDITPKPLILLAGQPLIVHAILACQQAGIRDIIINVSYKAETIMQALGDGSHWGVNIHYSQEAEPPLETAGGIIKALPLLGHDPFIALSGDIWTNYDLRQLIHRADSVKLAHLIMVPNPDFKTQGDFVLQSNRVLSNAGSDRLTYGNIGLFHPDLFQNLPVERLGLGALLHQHLNSGHITGELYTGEWFNIGTIDQLAQAEHMLKETLS